MKLIHKRDVIRHVRDRWNEQYPPHRDGDPSYLHDQTFGEIRRGLAALDLETCSAEDVTAVSGKSSWTPLVCDECDRPADALVSFGSEPAYDTRWQDVCHECVTKAATLFFKAPREA